jgi:hypothetical protein
MLPRQANGRSYKSTALKHLGERFKFVALVGLAHVWIQLSSSCAQGEWQGPQEGGKLDGTMRQLPKECLVASTAALAARGSAEGFVVRSAPGTSRRGSSYSRGEAALGSAWRASNDMGLTLMQSESISTPWCASSKNSR